MVQLTVRSTLWHRSLPAPSTDTHTVDDIALFGLVAEATSFIWAGWAGRSMNDVQLTELY